MTRSTTAAPAPTLSDLKIKHLAQLSQLLCLPSATHPNNPHWLAHQAQLITTLSPTLLRPSALLLRFAMRLPCSIPQAILCKTHKPLNPFLIHKAFLALTAETTIRLVHLVSNPVLEIPAHIQLFIRRLQCLSSLWMDPGAYRVSFGVSPHEARHERVENDCEACILARIGGDEQMVCDLRATLLGRRKKDKPRSGLERLVDAWVENLDVTTKEVLKETSDQIGKDVRGLRKEMQKLRREEKKKTGRSGILDSHISMSRPQSRAQVGSSMGTPKQSQSEWDSSDSTLNASSPFNPSRAMPTSQPLDDEAGTIHVLYDDRRSWSDNDDRDSRSLLNSHADSRSIMHNQDDREDVDQDFEDELLDYYGALTASEADSRNSIHPAFARKDSETYTGISYPTATAYRNSVIFDSAAGTFTQRSQSQNTSTRANASNPFSNSNSSDAGLMPAALAPRKAYTAYTASEYSRTDGFDDYSSRAESHALFDGRLRRNAEEQAEKYRKLVEMEEEFVVLPPRMNGFAAEREVNRSSPSTRWTDLY